MPRASLGARLYFDENRQNWVIRDGMKFVRTGAEGWLAAQEHLNEYIKTRPGKQPAARPVAGFIYFLTAEYPDFPIKIGFTQKPDWMRIKGLQTGCPYRIYALGAQPGVYRDEWKLQRRFAAQRLEGEWFTRTPDLMDFIGSLPPIEKAGQ